MPVLSCSSVVPECVSEKAIWSLVGGSETSLASDVVDLISYGFTVDLRRVDDWVSSLPGAQSPALAKALRDVVLGIAAASEVKGGAA